jgi:hypothetical protein
LRGLHAVVFVGLFAVTCAATWPELVHALRAQKAAYHPGSAPSVWAGLAFALGAVGVAGTLFFWLARDEARRWPTLFVLGGVGCALASSSAAAPEARSAPGGNLAILSAARALQQAMSQTLHDTRSLSDAPESWRPLVSSQASPVHDRRFRRVPFDVVRWPPEAPAPGNARPGTLGIWVSPDKASFQVRAVGFDAQGDPAPLMDAHGQTLVLSGQFLPQMGAGQ